MPNAFAYIVNTYLSGNSMDLRAILLLLSTVVSLTLLPIYIGQVDEDATNTQFVRTARTVVVAFSEPLKFLKRFAAEFMNDF